jgi:hypothetical protein
MPPRRWRLVNIRDIPADDRLPPPDDGVSNDERDAARAELRADADARVDVALETPTRLFMVGGRPGAYEPPVWAEDWRPPDDWIVARRGAT